jgi:hypothetical protein
MPQSSRSVVRPQLSVISLWARTGTRVSQWAANRPYRGQSAVATCSPPSTSDHGTRTG